MFLVILGMVLFALRKVNLVSKKIAIIMSAYVVYESPIIFNICEYLKGKGCSLTIFIDNLEKNKYKLKKDPYDGIGVKLAIYNEKKELLNKKFYKLLYLKIYIRFFSLLVKIIGCLTSQSKNIASISTRLKFLVYLSPYFKSIKKYAAFINDRVELFDYVIAVEPEGLLTYSFIKTKKPFCYLSLELNNLPKDKFDYIDIYKRKITSKYINLSEFIIIQDHDREIIFRECYKVNKNKKILYLPVSLRKLSSTKKSDYAYKKYNIKNNKKIIIYAGSIMEWACLEEIANSSFSWDDSFVLIIHGGRFDEIYLMKLKEIAQKNKNIILSTEWLTTQELADLLSSSSIGICIYRDNALNNRLTTFASHKLPTYFSNGIPVVTYSYPEMKEFIDSNKCGLTFSDYNNLNNIFNQILQEYNIYQENVIKVYDKYYDFDKNFTKIYDEICILMKISNLTSKTIDNLFEQEFEVNRKQIDKVLAYNDDDHLDIKIEERAFPGNDEFIKSSYYKIMLKRYIFTGSYFCKGKKVIDSCCGLGWGTYLVSEYASEVYAFDREKGSIEFCKQEFSKCNILWRVENALSLNINEKFDVALAMETLEHFNKNDGDLYIRKLASCLNDSGILIGTTGIAKTRKDAERMCSTNPFHLNIFTINEIEELLNKYFYKIKIINNWMFIAVK